MLAVFLSSFYAIKLFSFQSINLINIIKMEKFRLCDKHLKVVFEISQIKSGINIECFDVIDNETVAINIQFNKKEINSLIKYLLEIQGFITNTNRFVNRKEAYEIAYNANQIIGPNKGYSTNEIGLTSEDLY